LLTKQPEAIQVFQAYGQASDAEGVVPLIRDGEVLQETLRKHWQPLNLPKQWAPAVSSAWHVLDAGGSPFALMQGDFPDKTRYSAYFVKQGGRLLLDWKATTAFGSATFEELEKGTGDSSEVRGMISPAEFYNATWPERIFRSYRLVSPDGLSAIWCYVQRGSVAESRIFPLFKRGEILEETQEARKITLQLERGPADAAPNQWLIGQMLHLEWINP
jgi:hypothetical protein